ncbi:MAG TPA: DUF1826 domain-containing protein [Novosphingobium sp.]|nr:DUF1826 domain-containing protein [Novosphingobium sp.]
MTLPTLERTGLAWIAADDPAVLERIHDGHVHLALWRRRLSPDFGWIDSLDLHQIDDVQETLPVADLPVAVAAALRNAGYPDGRSAAALAMELVALARRFARIVAGEAVRIRLEVIETDACRKFHMDNVTARLLMPLTEPGTQWIEANGGADPQVNQLRAGDVGLFKGRLWTDAPAILHRSPPIAYAARSRVLLVIDVA